MAEQFATLLSERAPGVDADKCFIGDADTPLREYEKRGYKPVKDKLTGDQLRLGVSPVFHLRDK